MAYHPQGFLFQPSVSLALHSCSSFSSGIILGPRTEELGRSSSGSAFAPYSGSASSPGFNSHLPYGGEPRAAATLSSFMSPAYEPAPGLSGSLDYHPFGALGPYPYGDPSYRKNATRDATATLKAWLHEHRKNPYPTKGEKIMLAIITKMTLTQVSTWFANARRRLKKENKMTWTPRTRSEDEEDEDHLDPERNDEDEESERPGEEEVEAAVHCPSALDSCGLAFREDHNMDRGFTDPDFKDPRAGRTLHSPGPSPPSGAPPQVAALGPLSVSESERMSSLSKEHSESCGASQGPNVAPKPKLWSLAEMATSGDKSKGCSDSSQSGPQPRAPYPRHLYYTSPFLPGYSSYGPVGPLCGGPGPQLSGLQLQRAEVGRDCRMQLKRGSTNV